MATQTASSQGRSSKGRGDTQTSRGGKEMGTSGVESTKDKVYAVVSVLYHALQGAETYQQYILDAKKAGDDELVQFFEECRTEEEERATRAKSLLLERLEDEEGEDEESEDEDEDDEEDED
jgi:hypothetical protein